jgi:hypothetical protein
MVFLPKYDMNRWLQVFSRWSSAYTLPDSYWNVVAYRYGPEFGWSPSKIRSALLFVIDQVTLKQEPIELGPSTIRPNRLGLLNDATRQSLPTIRYEPVIMGQDFSRWSSAYKHAAGPWKLKITYHYGLTWQNAVGPSKIRSALSLLSTRYEPIELVWYGLLVGPVPWYDPMVFAYKYKIRYEPIEIRVWPEKFTIQTDRFQSPNQYNSWHDPRFVSWCDRVVPCFTDRSPDGSPIRNQYGPILRTGCSKDME